MKARRGFTLLEILIIVIIIGTLAAIVIPHFSGASTKARLANLGDSLDKVRGQIEYYKFQHDNLLPALSGETGADFVRRMTTQTNAAGDTGSDFGPYLQTIPKNVFNDLNTIRIDGAPAGSNINGWRFNTATGTFQADDSADHAEM